MEHLLSVWPKVGARVRDAGHILLLADYDGTLTPIVSRPELADLPEDTRGFLRALARQRHITVGVLSGRALSDLKDKVGIGGIIYAGNHGLEMEGPDLRFVNPVAEESRPILRIMHDTLTRAVGRIEGVLVEDKGLGISVHFRLAEEGAAKGVETAVKRIVRSVNSTGKTRITSGKEMCEVRPAVAWDKGNAIELLIEKYGGERREGGLLAMYLGDDLTDEDGFRAIEDSGIGISVLVGKQGRHDPDGTMARYFLQSPAEVATFLGMLLKQARRSEEDGQR